MLTLDIVTSWLGCYGWCPHCDKSKWTLSINEAERLPERVLETLVQVLSLPEFRNQQLAINLDSLLEGENRLLWFIKKYYSDRVNSVFLTQNSLGDNLSESVKILNKSFPKLRHLTLVRSRNFSVLGQQIETVEKLIDEACQIIFENQIFPHITFNLGTNNCPQHLYAYYSKALKSFLQWIEQIDINVDEQFQSFYNRWKNLVPQIQKFIGNLSYRWKTTESQFVLDISQSPSTVADLLTIWWSISTVYSCDVPATLGLALKLHREIIDSYKGKIVNLIKRIPNKNSTQHIIHYNQWEFCLIHNPECTNTPWNWLSLEEYWRVVHMARFIWYEWATVLHFYMYHFRKHQTQTPPSLH